MKTQSRIFRSQPSTMWLGVGALAALYGAFTLSWVIYRVHLPGLLTQFGFSAEFAPKLLLIEALLAIALEPLMGKLSDQLEKWRGSRFPLISLGVVLSSAFLVAVPAWVIFAPSVGVWRWWLPGLLIAWAIAMSVFRSPAVALLRQYATTARLPLAASVLTLASGLAGAAAPLAKQFILDSGAAVTFTVGAILLLGTAAVLRSFIPATVSPEVPRPSQRHSIPRLGLIFVTGLAVTLAFRLAIETFPKILTAQVPQLNPPLLVGTIFVTLALTALPAGRLAVQLGNRRAMLLGLVAGAGFLGLMGFTHSTVMAIGIAVGLGASLSLVTNGTLPLALSLVTFDQAGLGIGVFFAGVAAATSLFVGILGQPGVLSAIAGIWIGAIALLVAGLCVIASRDEVTSPLLTKAPTD